MSGKGSPINPSDNSLSGIIDESGRLIKPKTDYQRLHEENENKVHHGHLRLLQEMQDRLEGVIKDDNLTAEQLNQYVIAYYNLSMVESKYVYDTDVT